MIRGWLNLIVIFVAGSSVAAPFPCPPMPAAITEVNRNIKSDIKASAASIGRVKAGEVASKTEVTAQNLFGKYPNFDKSLALQMMSATYCAMLKSSASMSDNEKINRWEKFQDKVLNLQTQPDAKPADKRKSGKKSTAKKDKISKSKPSSTVSAPGKNSAEARSDNPPANTVNTPPAQVPVTITYKVENVDDRIRIRLDRAVLHEGGATNLVTSSIKPGDHLMEIEVYNQESYTGGVGAFGGHKREGWSYSVLLKSSENEWRFNDASHGEPPREQFGTWFLAARGQISVTSAGLVSVKRM